MPERSAGSVAPRSRRRVLVLIGAAALVVVVGAVAFVLLRDSGGEDVPGPAAGDSRVEGFGELGVSIRTARAQVIKSCLLAADTDAQRQQGLMRRRDLAGYDGMLFRYRRERLRAFWMRNTPMPLSIAFFDGDGRFVSLTDMRPCGDDPGCPQYLSRGAAQFAIEVPRGRLDEIGAGPGSHLTLDGPCRS